MNTLLVPVDFSDVTPAVVEEARRLAGGLNFRAHLLHVIEPVASYVPVGASMDVLATPVATGPGEVQTAQRRLEALAESFQANGIEAEAEAVMGLAVDEILERASRQDCAMIVMGSHGHGALYHLFNGSVVNGVLRRARLPIVVVPAGERKG